jgi:hypothetical protein
MVHTLAGSKNDAAAASPVSAVGTTPRNESLAPEAGATVAAVSGLNFDLNAVDKHNGLLPRTRSERANGSVKRTA